MPDTPDPLGSRAMKVHVLHENPEWLPPFAAAFDDQGVPWEEWHLDGGPIELDAAPPSGIFYSRMSASNHTRGHGLAKDHTRSVLSWLEGHGRRVVNGRRVLELEMSKVDQHAALTAAGFDVPRTIAVVGRQGIEAQARRLPLPFITKHNQGGKGLGVQRFDTYEAFDAHLADPAFEEPVDHTLLLQEYVEPVEPFITRVEVVGGELLYALRADTSHGFELCPADVCTIHDDFCPTGEHAARIFSHRSDIDAATPLVRRYLSFCRRWGIEIAGFEFIETADGRRVTYDVNTNTNYNTTVEAQAGRSGPTEVARFLGRLLDSAGDGTPTDVGAVA
jgi:hypothetical protein